MTPLQILATLLRILEGCKLTAYQDSRGIWTIGFGHTSMAGGLQVTPGLVITYDQAVTLLEVDAAPLLARVSNHNPLEAAALASFGYNCGIGALGKVLAGQSKVMEYVNVNHVPILAPRRALEDMLINVSRQLQSGGENAK